MNVFIIILSLYTLATVSAQTTTKVDYSTHRCMPQVAPELQLIKDLQKPGGPPCLIFARPLAAVSMAEYADCMASTKKILRRLSRLQVIECAVPKITDCASLPTSKPISGLDYITNVGLELDFNYTIKHNATAGTGEICHSNGSQSVFKFKSVLTMLTRTEDAIATALQSKGPVLVNLYMNSTRAFSADPRSLTNYINDTFDTEFLCPANTTAEMLKIDPVKGFEAVKIPATIVGFDRVKTSRGLMHVWIGRIDYFGPNWGRNGYFYMRKGINACNIGANPMQILN